MPATPFKMQAMGDYLFVLDNNARRDGAGKVYVYLYGKSSIFLEVIIEGAQPISDFKVNALGDGTVMLASLKDSELQYYSLRVKEAVFAVLNSSVFRCDQFSDYFLEGVQFTGLDSWAMQGQSKPTLEAIIITSNSVHLHLNLTFSYDLDSSIF